MTYPHDGVAWGAIYRKREFVTSPSPELPQKKKANPVWRAISTVIAVAITIFMLSLIQWQDFLDVLGRLSLPSMLATFAVYVLLNFFRAMRYRTLLNRDELPVSVIFPISLYHNFLVRLLPFKLGELTYIIYMRNRLDVDVREGVSSLFGSRLFELLVILLVGAIALVLAGDIVTLPLQIIMPLILLMIVGGIVGFYFTGTLLRLGNRVLGLFASVAIVPALITRVDALASEFDRISRPGIMARALFWSCCTYSSSFAVNAILLLATGIEVDFITLILLVSLGMFAGAFPFNISGFGLIELSWAFGLTTFLGMTTSEATSIGLMLNGFQLFSALVSGAIAYGVLQLPQMKKAA